MKTEDRNLKDWESLAKELHELSKDQTMDATFFFIGFLQSRMQHRTITSGDVCDAMRNAIRDQKRVYE